jgi:hypothetical protein
LQKIAQSSSGYAVVQLSAYRQIRPEPALVLAEPARESNRGVQSMALNMLMDDREILRISSREAGTSKANHNFNKSIV